MNKGLYHYYYIDCVISVKYGLNEK